MTEHMPPAASRAALPPTAVVMSSAAGGAEGTNPVPPAATPAPSTAPTRECVVDTGAPTAVAMLSHSAPASNAARMRAGSGGRPVSSAS